MWNFCGCWFDCCSALHHPIKKVLTMWSDFYVFEEIAFGSEPFDAGWKWTREGFLVSLKYMWIFCTCVRI